MGSAATAPGRPRLRLRTLLIGINLIVLLLPVAGIQLLRLYESALVRQTESALIAQAAFVAAFYRALLLEAAPRTWPLASRPLPEVSGIWRAGEWVPRPPELDLASSPRLAPFPDGVAAGTANPLAVTVGERLIPVLKDAQLVTLAGIRVVDPSGVVIASTGSDIGLNIQAGEEISVALSGLSVSRLRQRADVPAASPLDSISRTTRVRVFVASPILLHQRLVGAVMLSRTPPNIVQALYAKRWLLLQALLVVLALVVIMSLLASRLIARPIRRLVHRADQVARGELSAPELVADGLRSRPRTRELHGLEQAIGAMAEALDRRARYLQEFSRHVSHEFKTPITGIRGAIEVLLDHGREMDEAQRLRFLQNIAADADRLQRLTERLLDLTRAELLEGSAAPFAVVPCLQQALAARDETEVVVRLQPPVEQPQVHGNPEALQGVIEILLQNAIQHGAKQVDLIAEVVAGRLEIRLLDDGKGISQGNRERIFEPFFTTQRAAGGTGLGLAIARRLLEPFAGTLTLVEDPERRGAGFLISLPLVQ